MQAEEFESFEEEIVDRATAAQTIQELEAEIAELALLEEQALHLRNSNQDRKWDELSTLLQETPVMRDAEGNQRKLIIFTEHRDTLHYLERKIRNLLGSEESVVLDSWWCSPRRTPEGSRAVPERLARRGSCWRRTQPAKASISRMQI